MTTDASRTTIPWVEKRNADGSTTVFSASPGGAAPKGERRVMDCIDCHNRAAHTFVTAEDALNRAMAELHACTRAHAPKLHAPAPSGLRNDFPDSL